MIICPFCNQKLEQNKGYLYNVVCENHGSINVSFGIVKRSLFGGSEDDHEINTIAMSFLNMYTLIKLYYPDITTVYIRRDNCMYDKIGEFKDLNITPENFYEKTNKFRKLKAFL